MNDALENRAAELMGAAAYGYFAGGAGDERVIARNVEQWQQHPVGIAPMAYQRHAHDEGEVAREGGHEALVITVDFPIGGIRERDRRTAFAPTHPTLLDRVAAADGVALTLAKRHALHDPSHTWRWRIRRRCWSTAASDAAGTWSAPWPWARTGPGPRSNGWCPRAADLDRSFLATT